VIFGLVNLHYWLIFAGYLHVSADWRKWAWLIGVVALIPVMLVLRNRFPQPTGAAARAMMAAWGSVGIAITVAGIALGLGAWRLQLPLFVVWTFPVVLFTLYGTAWSVAFSVKRRPWYALVAAGCFLATILCGALMGTPSGWLVLGLGLFLLVAAPGAVIAHQARKA
jgi:hypothetical protein